MTERRDLLDLFTPPDGHVGTCGVLVAMTADADFLEAALRRFSNLSAAQRSDVGALKMYLMLDGHVSTDRAEVFAPNRIPGLYELQPKRLDPETLIHAKLAVLSFGTSHSADPTYFRLAVLTSNLTYAAASQHLELVWALNVPAYGAPAVDRADLAEAGRFVTTLLERRFHRPDGADRRRGGLMSGFDVLLRAIEGIRPQRPAGRFIHSLDEPLFPQIRRRFRRHPSKRRNLLLCGSAFYEQPAKGKHQPFVLQKLSTMAEVATTLRRIALVEPAQAGAIAGWADRAGDDGWELLRPSDPVARVPRHLHAKFIYLGTAKGGRISSGSLYIGSGNLTKRGLFSDGASRGNVECGVVLAVEASFEQDAFGSMLFWNKEERAIGLDEFQVGDVGDAPEVQELISPPPILAGYLTHVAPATTLNLTWSDEPFPKVSLSWTGADWRDVSERPAALVISGEPAPSVLQVRDDASGRQWQVPVVDAAGRVAWSPPTHRTFAEALDALLAFPIELDSEPDAENEEMPAGAGAAISPRRSDDIAPAYPLYAAADLIERLGDFQACLPEDFIADWLDHLERQLASPYPDPPLQTWRAQGIAIFAHLQHRVFRPAKLTPTQLQHYKSILENASARWAIL